MLFALFVCRYSVKLVYLQKKAQTMTELVIQIEDKSILPSLKKVMRSIQGVKSIALKTTTPAISPTAQRLLKDLADYESYKKGWDDESAAPLSPIVIKSFKRLLEKSNEDDLKDWNIFPEKNGTMILENSKRQAQINLAEKEFSYFILADSGLKGEDHIKLSTSRLLKAIEAINHD